MTATAKIATPVNPGTKATKVSAKDPAKGVAKAIAKPAIKAATAPKAVAKPKPVANPTTKVAAKPVAANAITKDVKTKKPKMVRDSFTFPKDEYQAIAGLKQKALGLQHSAKKSEILRAGLMLLNGLNDKAFLAALSKVPALKTGRPAKS